MNKTMKLLTICLLTAIGSIATLNAASPLDNVSVETLAVINQDLDGGQDYGAGLDLGYKFNKYVAAHGRIVTLSNDDWRGPAIDEVSLLGEATLFRSTSGVTLSAIGGGEYDVNDTDVGLSAGLRAGFPLTKNLSVVAEGRYRLWREGNDDVPLVAGLKLSF